MLCRSYVYHNSHFWTKLPLAANGTFLFSKFVCTWLLILHVRMQYWKTSRVTAMESFSIELIEAIVQKCSKKRCFRNIGGTYKKTHTNEIKIIGCNLATMAANIRPKICVQKLCIWRPGCSYVCPLHVHFMSVFY